MTRVIISEPNRYGKISVTAPYLPRFINKAKRTLAGRWDSDSRAWMFDERDTDRVRALCMDCFGTDGTTVQLVVMRIRVHDDAVLRARNQSIFLAGRCIARSGLVGARLGEGVVLLWGEGPTRVGSMRNWETRIVGRTVLEVRDVPITSARRAVEQHPIGCDIEIVE